ncbi:MAG TPA: hypothetical protein VGG64_22335 [Pirellulales bacterium]|jgi:hypothetical protein
MSDGSTTRRRWFSYSLRSVFFLLTLVAIGLGWVASERKRSERELLIAEDLKTRGARIDIAGRFDGSDPFSQPAWWQRSLSRVCGQKVRQVIVDGPSFSGEIPEVAALTKLSGIGLHWTQIRDLSPLAKLTSLENITVDGGPVSNISPLAELTNLVGLDLNVSGVKDVSALAKLGNLTVLRLQTSGVTDLSPLVGLKKLRYLNVRQTPISDEQIELLKSALPDCEIDK